MNTCKDALRVHKACMTQTQEKLLDSEVLLFLHMLTPFVHLVSTVKLILYSRIARKNVYNALSIYGFRRFSV